MPRSATKLTKSFEAHVKELHRRAEDLEKQLHAGKTSSSNNNNNDERANRLRLPLCEIMADLILTDPSSCTTKDVPGRLWRLCFYTRIAHWRKRISADKKRGLDTSRIEESLSVFLAEGVTLYKYLIDKLRIKLAKKAGLAVSETSTTSFSQGSMSTMYAPPATESTEGVVPLLAACYLSLGDLFRYSQNLEQAEGAYQMSSTLAPGIGHAFNQLAVVCQLKEQKGAAPLSAVALYWYTRSLLVTNDPFTTSKANLERIFANNHEWLMKEQAESNDRSKSAQTRRFLGMFVDLHFRFFQGVGEDNIEQLMDQMQSVMERFQSLLEMSAFGDALLCRLVVIHAFSECYFDIPGGGSPSALSMVMARVATYQFGSRLTGRVIVGLSKVADGKVPSSVRLLLPTLLLAEYTGAVAMPETDNPQAVEALHTARRIFWESMISIWNKLEQISAAKAVPVAAEELKEFLALRGFGPFSFISPCKGGFLPEEEALEALMSPAEKKDKSNETASTGTTSVNSSASTDQGRLKLSRIMQLGEKMAADTESTVGRFIEKDNEGKFRWADTEEDSDSALPMEVEADEEEDDVLMYKTGSNGGPALLVPGTLLQQEDEDDAMQLPSTTPKKSSVSPESLPVFDNKAVNLERDMHRPFPEPTDVTVDSGTGTTAFTTLPNAGARLPPGLQSSARVLPPPPGFGAPGPPGTLQRQPEPIGQSWHPQSDQPETISDALRLYGLQMQTANPFENPVPPGLSDTFNSGPGNHGEADFLGANDPMSVEAPSLLDSGLLNSLWMDDPKNKTKNPFAT